ncbi:META domain-containing protein [Psychrobacter sp. M9-54-1]|uniref:META domain-containing protein n=1 Tax=Psychrobacter sp. M9-54-1 TaxID=2782386 RepID=UPI00190BFDD8|nr:META domain-containing protein [Psychrobacter sp. M9-54-1]MBK3394100.1 META domain-containing protein [Psychrobacter sp. M9-54-1]
MLLPTIKRSLTIISLSVAVGLMGCQSAPLNSTQQTTIVNTPITKDKSNFTDQIVIKESQVMQWVAHYDWQLAQVINQNGNIVDIENFAPITLAIEPSAVRFYQGCEQYMIDFQSMSAPPYPYYSHLAKVPTTCHDDNNTDTAIKEDNSIQSLFVKYAPVRLNFELLPTSHLTSESAPVVTQAATKRLALNIENGNRLIFSGTAKAIPTATGLPITNELLEKYHWTLVSAVSNAYDKKGELNRKPLGNFYHPDYPISASFESWPNNQYASFSSGCNGSRAPYFLLNDNTFKVGTIISTVMGCGETGNRIESALFDLMRDSSSQLMLSLQPSQPLSPTADNQTDMPRYNLLQTMATGETLIWQNEVKKTL